MVLTYKEVAGVNGSQFLAKGLERGFQEIDVTMNRAAMAPHLRPSTWLNVAMGLGTQLGSLLAKVRAPWDLILVSEGAHHLTKLVDYLEEYVTPALGAGAGARIVYRPGAGAGAGARVNYGNQRAMTRPPGARVGVPASYDVTPYRAV